MFPDKMRVSSFRKKVPTLCPDSSLVSPLRLGSVKGVCVFKCNLPPVLLAERPGSFTCHCGNTGVERTPDKSQHTKLTLEKKILPPLLLGFGLATLRSRVRRSNQLAIPKSMYNTANYAKKCTTSRNNIYHLVTWVNVHCQRCVICMSLSQR